MTVPVRLLSLSCALAWAGAAQANAPAPPEEVAAGLTPAECEVWARELSFARSVAEHDPAAFAEHVHPAAAFNSGQPQPRRGRDLIAADWAGLIAGKDLILAWYPTRVTIGGVDNVAWSSGPALFEWPSREPSQRFAIGTYHSVWHKDADGVWRILFDQGAGMKPAGGDEVKAFRAGRRADCPAG